MNNAQLFSLAMGEIDDRYVEEALSYQAPVKSFRRHTLQRYLAVACLVVILVINTALAVSAGFREAVFGWVRDQYETFMHYAFHAEEESGPPVNVEEPAHTRYMLPQLPEGYSERDYYSVEGTYRLRVYEKDGRLLYFYAIIGTAGELFVQEDGTTVRQVEVAGATGDLYIPDDPERHASLVWVKGDVLFLLGGCLTAEELLYYAELVQEDPAPYEPFWVPEGYTSISQDYHRTYGRIDYTDEEHSMLCLTYSRDPEDAPVQADYENHTHTTAAVHGMTADLYLADNSEMASSISWEEDGVIYRISAVLPGEELIALAESVEGVCIWM